MATTVLKIFELQNTGKGIITSMLPQNLLKTFDSEQGVQGLGNVLDVDNDIVGTKTIDITEGSRLTIQPIDLTTDFGGTIQLNNIGDEIPVSESILSSIGKKLSTTFSGIKIREDKLIVEDGFDQKGLENLGDYEANFTDRSLITKQYYEDNLPTVDGTETKVTAGTNTTVTGNGSTGTPYIINSQTYITAGEGVSITGSGTSVSPFVINTPDNRVRNVGYFEGFDPGGPSTGLTVSGDITIANTVNVTTNDSVVTITFANPMDNLNYYIRTFIQSMSASINDDNDILTGVFKPINTTSASLGFREVTTDVQNVRVHLEIVQY